MTPIIDATDEQMTALDGLVDTLQVVDGTISRLLAARDGLLALGSRWALEVAMQGDHPDDADMVTRTVAAEIGAALRTSDRTVQRRMAEAEWFVTRFPRLWQAQGAGRISAAQARAIVDAGEHLERAEDRDAYAEEMIEVAARESPHRVARYARRVAERLQSRSLDERHQQARERRRVWVRDRPDGMAELGMLGPAVLVHGAFDRLTAMAKASHSAASGAAAVPDLDSAPEPGSSPDSRTLDQVRTDLLLDTLLSGAPTAHDVDGSLGSIVAQVSITVPVLTLMNEGLRCSGRDDPGPNGPDPGELVGRSPIDPQTARQLAGAASGWDRVLTHPVSGAVLAVDRYRPSADLRRHLRARDQRCRFPGCGRTPQESDIDHTHDAALGGATADGNLAHLCRRHHMLKHHSPWRVSRLDDGAFAWTSPTGRLYIDRPEAPPTTVVFREEPEPPAWWPASATSQQT